MNKDELIERLQAQLPTTKRLAHARGARMAERYNMSHAQLEAFFVLQTSVSVTTKDLAEQLHITPSAVSPVIESLSKLGYIERATDKDDRRKCYLSLSDEGKKMAKTVRADKQVLLTDVLSSLTVEELTVLVKLQSRLVEKIQLELSKEKSKEVA